MLISSVKALSTALFNTTCLFVIVSVTVISAIPSATADSLPFPSTDTTPMLLLSTVNSLLSIALSLNTLNCIKSISISSVSPILIDLFSGSIFITLSPTIVWSVLPSLVPFPMLP